MRFDADLNKKGKETVLVPETTNYGDNPAAAALRKSATIIMIVLAVLGVIELIAALVVGVQLGRMNSYFGGYYDYNPVSSAGGASVVTLLIVAGLMFLFAYIAHAVLNGFAELVQLNYIRTKQRYVLQTAEESVKREAEPPKPRAAAPKGGSGQTSGQNTTSAAKGAVVVPIADGDRIICPVCNKAQTAERRNCYNCGAVFREDAADADKYCPKCGTKNKSGMSFCKNCGTAI